MAIGLSTTARNARLTALITAIDAGSGPGVLSIYSGTRPATGGTATTLLAELTLSDPCGTVSGGVLTFNAITQDSSANASGTASWARIVDSDAAFVLDLGVGTAGSGMEIILNTTTIVAGGPVGITSASLTEGNP